MKIFILMLISGALMPTGHLAPATYQKNPISLTYQVHHIKPANVNQTGPSLNIGSEDVKETANSDTHPESVYKPYTPSATPVPASVTATKGEPAPIPVPDFASMGCGTLDKATALYPDHEAEIQAVYNSKCVCPASTADGTYYIQGYDKNTGQIVCGFEYYHACPYADAQPADGPVCQQLTEEAQK